MPWLSTNLSAAMPGIADKANAAIAQVQSGVSKLQKQADTMTGTMDKALAALTVNRGDLAKITDAGFYMITLSPQKGAWDTRLRVALGEPPNRGFCCGTANIILAADLAGAASSLAKVKDMLKKPVENVEAFIDSTDFSDFLPDLETDLLEEMNLSQFAAPSWDELFKTDEWKSASLGDVFGGAMEGLAGVTNGAVSEAKSLLKGINQTKKLTAGLSKGLSVAKNLVADLAATGTYNIILPPASGGYLSRLKSEIGAPPSDSQMYSAGFVCIALAPDASSLVSKYATLNKIVTGGK